MGREGIMEGKKFEIEAEKNGTGENAAEAEKAVKRGARSWKVDFVMGIIIVAAGLPFFAVDYKIAGIIMAVIGGFCIVSGLCQKVAESEEKR